MHFALVLRRDFASDNNLKSLLLSLKMFILKTQLGNL